MWATGPLEVATEDGASTLLSGGVWLGKLERHSAILVCRALSPRIYVFIATVPDVINGGAFGSDC